MILGANDYEGSAKIFRMKKTGNEFSTCHTHVCTYTHTCLKTVVLEFEHLFGGWAGLDYVYQKFSVDERLHCRITVQGQFLLFFSPLSGVSKLAHGPTCFLKKILSEHRHTPSLICHLRLSFMLKQQSWAVVTESVPAKSKMFTHWSFKEKVCWLLPDSMDQLCTPMQCRTQLIFVYEGLGKWHWYQESKTQMTLEEKSNTAQEKIAIDRITLSASRGDSTCPASSRDCHPAERQVQCCQIFRRFRNVCKSGFSWETSILNVGDYI